MPALLTIWRRSLCAVTGAIAGGSAGLVLGLVQTQTPMIVLLPSQVVQVGLLLGVVAWFGLLMVVGVWLHYGIATIALPALVTSVLSSLLTIFVANQVLIPLLAVWIGLVVGTLVGLMLCRLCTSFQERMGGIEYGVR